jgi:signal-transduction protein with cAMP-binding, CBS, and nucleotidyltransferase domain
MGLSEFIHSPAVTCSPDTPVAEAARRMDENNVGSVIVTGSDGKLSGIVTDRDIAIRGMAAERAPGTPVAEVMTKNVVWLREDANIFDATRQIATAGRRRLPVIGADDIPRGLISLDDLLLLFTRQIDSLANAVAAETVIPTRQS